MAISTVVETAIGAGEALPWFGVVALSAVAIWGYNAYSKFKNTQPCRSCGSRKRLNVSAGPGRSKEVCGHCGVDL